MNRVILTGRLAADPEYRVTQSGIANATFRLAVDRRFKAADGTKQTDFLPVVCWRQTAELVKKYIGKGRRIGVVGTVQVRSYDANDGSKRYITEIIADEIEFLDSAKSSGAFGNDAPPPNAPDDFQPVDDDDLPF